MGGCRRKRSGRSEEPGAHFPLPGWTEAPQSAPPPPLPEGHFSAPASSSSSSLSLCLDVKKLHLPPRRGFTPTLSVSSEFSAHGSATLRLLSGWDLAAVSGDGVKARRNQRKENPQFSNAGVSHVST